jgi:hypothetical protein
MLNTKKLIKNSILLKTAMLIIPLVMLSSCSTYVETDNHRPVHHKSVKHPRRDASKHHIYVDPDCRNCPHHHH